MISNASCFRLFLLCSICGCAPSAPPEPPRFHISGKITFNGQPIPAGSIQFEPLGMHDKPELLGGYAAIENGSFDTRKAGRGHFGGKVNAQIYGYDGIPEGEQAQGKPVFPALKFELELPTKDDTRDFNLPLKP